MYIHMSGLSKDIDNIGIRNFFSPIIIPNGGVEIIGDNDVMIQFESTQDILTATNYDGKRLNGNPVRLKLCDEKDRQQIIANIWGNKTPWLATQSSNSTHRQASHTSTKSLYEQSYTSSYHNPSQEAYYGSPAQHQSLGYSQSLSGPSNSLSHGQQFPQFEQSKRAYPQSVSRSGTGNMQQPLSRANFQQDSREQDEWNPQNQDDWNVNYRQQYDFKNQNQLGPYNQQTSTSYNQQISDPYNQFKTDVYHQNNEHQPRHQRFGNLYDSYSHNQQKQINMEENIMSQESANHRKTMNQESQNKSGAKFYIKIQNIPSDAKFKWIYSFLSDCSVIQGSITIIHSEKGALDAYCNVETKSDVQKALKRDFNSVGNNIIKVNVITKEKMEMEIAHLPGYLKASKENEAYRQRSGDSNQKSYFKPNYSKDQDAQNQKHFGHQENSNYTRKQNQSTYKRTRDEPLNKDNPPKRLKWESSALYRKRVAKMYQQTEKSSKGNETRNFQGPYKPQFKKGTESQNKKWKGSKNDAIQSKGNQKGKSPKGVKGPSNQYRRVSLNSNVNSNLVVFPEQEKIEITGLPLSEIDIQKDFKKWLKENGVSFEENINYDEDKNAYIVTANGHINPTLPRSSILRGRAFRIEHPLQSIPHCHYCRNFFCEKQYNCPVWNRKNKSVTFVDHKSPTLSPIEEEFFDYNGRSFCSIMTAMVAEMAPDLGYPHLQAEAFKAKSRESTKRILDSLDSFEVRNWQLKNEHVIKDILTAKYNQSPLFQKQLAQTGDEIILYAVANWVMGVGLMIKVHQDWAKNIDPVYLPGLNTYGRTLMQIRKDKLGVAFEDYRKDCETLILPRVVLDKPNEESLPSKDKMKTQHREHENENSQTEPAMSFIIKGLPVDYPITKVLEWLEAEPRKIETGKFFSSSRMEKSFGQVRTLIFELKKEVNPILPVYSFIDGHACKIYFRKSIPECPACRFLDCDQSNCIAIDKNLSVFLVDYKGESVLSPENCLSDFQFEGKAYCSVLHVFVSKIARVIKKDNIAKKILEAKSPLAVRKCMERLKTYESFTWQAKKFQLLKDIYLAKWNYDPLFRQALQGTGTNPIVYTSIDPVLGCGLSPKKMQPNIKPEYLPGMNYVGKVLMEIRDDKC